MSIHKRNEGYQVKWRDAQGRQRSQQVARLRDAQKLDGELKRKRAMGELAAWDAGTTTLAEFGEAWYTGYASSLSPRTREVYASLYDKYILPALGNVRLRELDVTHVEMLAGTLTHLSPASARKVLTLLQGILQRAVERKIITTNPAKLVRKPQPQSRVARALAPSQVETLRLWFVERDDWRGATAVGLMAYAGLRPGELRGLIWGNVGANSLHIVQAISHNKIVAPKAKSVRLVKMLPALGSDVREYRLRCGRPGDSSYVITAGRDPHAFWTDNAYRLWAGNTFRTACKDCGLGEDVTPYYLRHSFVSLLVQSGETVFETARQAGHDPAQTLSTYGHIFDAIDTRDRRPANEFIKEARA